MSESEWTPGMLRAVKLLSAEMERLGGGIDDVVATEIIARESGYNAVCEALEKIAGDCTCSGPMTHDEKGNRFPEDIMQFIAKAHADRCNRCIATAALRMVRGEPLSSSETPSGSQTGAQGEEK